MPRKQPASPKDKSQARAATSDAFEAIHSAAAALRSVGVIDKKTMREDRLVIDMANE